MTKPIIAATTPAEAQLEAGKKYAFCTCGRSAEQPFCDGAHKVTDFKPLVFTAEKSETVWLCRCKQTKDAPICDGSHKQLNSD